MNVSPNLLPIFVFLSLNYFALSQSQIKIEGKIIDVDKNNPIEFACVSIHKTSIGTLSSSSGHFSLLVPSNINQAELAVSCIGYETKYVNCSNLKSTHNTIKLKSKPTLLNTVVVVPDNYLQNLLRSAFNKIKDNYPDKPVNYENFYRETMISDDKLLYFSEALFNTYQSSYISNEDYQMKMLKSRKYIDHDVMDTTIHVKFYGGAFCSQRYDFVFNKESFINPDNFKSYNYKLTDITTFNNDSVYVVSFHPKKKGEACYNGILYIDKETLAYVAADYSKEEDCLYDNPKDALLITFKSKTIKTNYIKINHYCPIKV